MFKFEQSCLPRDDTAAEGDLAMLRVLLRQRLPVAGSRVLDFSCHTDSWRPSLNRLFRTSFVESLDPNLVDILGKHHRSFFEFPTDIYDLIVWKNEAENAKAIADLLCKCAGRLADGGRFVVVSSNPTTARARIARFASDTTGTLSTLCRTEKTGAKSVPINKLYQLVERAGLRVIHIEYTPSRLEELAMLPFALIIWLGQLLCFVHETGSRYRVEDLRAMFPFLSLLSNHYVLVCERA